MINNEPTTDDLSQVLNIFFNIRYLIKLLQFTQSSLKNAINARCLVTF